MRLACTNCSCTFYCSLGLHWQLQGAEKIGVAQHADCSSLLACNGSGAAWIRPAALSISNASKLFQGHNNFSSLFDTKHILGCGVVQPDLKQDSDCFEICSEDSSVIHRGQACHSGGSSDTLA